MTLDDRNTIQKALTTLLAAVVHSERPTPETDLAKLLRGTLTWQIEVLENGLSEWDLQYGEEAQEAWNYPLTAAVSLARAINRVDTTKTV